MTESLILFLRVTESQRQAKRIHREAYVLSGRNLVREMRNRIEKAMQTNDNYEQVRNEFKLSMLSYSHYLISINFYVIHRIIMKVKTDRKTTVIMKSINVFGLKGLALL